MLVSKNLIIFNKAFLIYTKANFRNGILECRKRVIVCLLSLPQKKNPRFCLLEITKYRGVCHSYRQRATCHWESSEHWKSSAPWRLGSGGSGKNPVNFLFGNLKNTHTKNGFQNGKPQKRCDHKTLAFEKCSKQFCVPDLLGSCGESYSKVQAFTRTLYGEYSKEDVIGSWTHGFVVKKLHLFINELNTCP